MRLASGLCTPQPDLNFTLTQYQRLEIFEG